MLFSGTLLYGYSMQVPILWHVHVYVRSSTYMLAYTYLPSEKSLLQSSLVAVALVLLRGKANLTAQTLLRNCACLALKIVRPVARRRCIDSGGLEGVSVQFK